MGAALVLLASGFGLGNAVRLREEPPPAAALARRNEVRGRSLAADAERLRLLGYVERAPAPDGQGSGVLLHDAERAAAGYGFYNSTSEAGARLIDMAGNTVHRWSADTQPWQSAALLRDGSVLGLVNDRELVKLDRDSKLLWRYRARVHHDLWVTPQGEIYVLTREPEPRPEIHAELATLVDRVSVLDAGGRLRDRFSLLDALQRSPYAFLLPSVRHFDPQREPGELDLLHANHVEVFDGSLAHRSPLYAAGNLLVSLRNVNAVAILDGATREIAWLWGPSNLSFPHHPSLLADGGLLVFDNGTERSRVVELDPLDGQLRWQWSAEGFFSKTRGGAQRLPGGNTLVTESDAGTVLEIAPDGAVVWKFANPDLDPKGARAAIWRMTRLSPSELPWLPPRRSAARRCARAARVG